MFPNFTESCVIVPYTAPFFFCFLDSLPGLKVAKSVFSLLKVSKALLARKF